jgi:glycosyltransferase involved in cell wall biosynthesis
MNHAEHNRESQGNEQYPACLSVVVPVYNEQTTLAEVVGKLLDVPCLLEIIIVDDCSTDRTAEVAAELAARHSPVRVVRQPRNAGKTAALKTGNTTQLTSLA